MPNTGECPSAAVESHLSWILEVDVPVKYYLTPQACQGILNRAERRKKELPQMLKAALIWQRDHYAEVLRARRAPGAGRSDCNGAGWREDVSYTLNTMDRHAVMCMMSSQEHAEIDNDLCGTLSCKHEQPIVCTGIDCRHFADTGDVIPPLQAGEGRGYTLNGIHAVLINSVVRRLTPLECERLQGYPDGWAEIPDYIDSRGWRRKTSDSARYTALGNSIALPQWRYVLGNISRYLPPGATLGSLFDGIGGFPLVWEEIHGKGTAVWASEINEFCIAVTKYRFGG